MTESSPYQSISCASYSEYELHIMRGQRLELAWQDLDGKVRKQQLKPVDLKTAQGEEFLIAMDSENNKIQLRLDRIQHCQPV